MPDINIYHNPDRPAEIKTLSPKRDWMKDSGAYHCPPMLMGNTLGWYFEIDESVTINWDGNPMPGSVKITLTETGEDAPNNLANSNFGSGVVTFPIPRRPMFETPENYSLLVYGPTNTWIDGIQPLTGIVETDWSASPFTMNWKITKTNQDVVIPKDHPIMCFIPINLNELESFKINFKDIDKWDRLDEVKIFQESRPENPHLDQHKVKQDPTHGLYSKGVDLNKNKVKDRRKTVNLFSPNLKYDTINTMPIDQQIHDQNHPIFKEISDIWNPKKEYIDKDLWVIRNFLSQEEIDWIMTEISKPEEWYTTMRSPYKNILNKFPDVIPKYNEDGILISQFDKKTESIEIPIFHSTYGIDNRLRAILPQYFYSTAAAIQTFLSVREDDLEMVNLSKKSKRENFSMDWHYERHPDSINYEIKTGAFSVYLNDNFQGGELLFKNKPDIVISPEPGMLVNIPLTEEFTHKVSFVSGGDRHTLYGSCYSKQDHISSTIEDC